MARSSIGLDIGTSAVRAAEIAGKDPPTLVRFGQVALPEGAVVNGEIADAHAVSQAIRDLWRRGGFKRKQVSTAIANQKIVVRQVDLPFMEEEELRGALRFQVQEHIPFPIEDAILDFLLLEETADEGGARMMRVLVVAAVKEMINSFVEAIQAAGLTPVAIDYSAFAAVRSLVDPAGALLEPPQPEALLDIGAGVTTILVHLRGSPRFVRLLALGGRDVTEALQLGLGMSPDEAEQQKAVVGLPLTEGSDSRAGEIIERRAAMFVEEVRSSLEYYQGQTGAEHVSRVVMTGGGSRLPRFGERLSNALRTPVEEAQPLARVRLGKLGLSAEQLADVSSVAAVAVGLALEGP